jgi:hypothetical protein
MVILLGEIMRHLETTALQTETKIKIKIKIKIKETGPFPATLSTQLRLRLRQLQVRHSAGALSKRRPRHSPLHVER